MPQFRSEIVGSKMVITCDVTSGYPEKNAGELSVRIVECAAGSTGIDVSGIVGTVLANEDYVAQYRFEGSEYTFDSVRGMYGQIACVLGLKSGGGDRPVRQISGLFPA
jgi:hypothetical protein